MTINSRELFYLVVICALIAPFGAALWMRLRRGASWGSTIGAFLATGMAQLLAVVAVGLDVNRQYHFYSSWSDVAGLNDGQPADITSGTINAGTAGDGTTTSFMVHALKTSDQARALAWLPPGYNDAANASKRYPVMVVLPGYSNTVESTYDNLNFGKVASNLIKSGRVAPFIAVFAPYQTVQGRDTECTDVKGGAKDYTFLTKAVPTAIQHNVRAANSSAQWSSLGWSTGGYCAAKALWARPAPWSSAVSIGGYYEALTDYTTGNLYPTKLSRILNSPSELYQRYQLQTSRILIVSSKQDKDGFASAQHFAKMTKDDPNVSTMFVAHGGHNFHTYNPYLPQMLEWSFKR